MEFPKLPEYTLKTESLGMERTSWVPSWEIWELLTRVGAEGFGSPRIGSGALGQTLNFLCLVFLIYKVGIIPTSQVSWEVKLEFVVESTLPDVTELLLQQCYFSLTALVGSQGFPLREMWKARCGHWAQFPTGERNTWLRAGTQVLRQNHTAMYWMCFYPQPPNSYVRALISNVTEFGDRVFKRLPRLNEVLRPWSDEISVLAGRDARELTGKLSLHLHAPQKAMWIHSKRAAVYTPALLSLRNCENVSTCCWSAQGAVSWGGSPGDWPVCLIRSHTGRGRCHSPELTSGTSTLLKIETRWLSCLSQGRFIPLLLSAACTDYPCFFSPTPRLILSCSALHLFVHPFIHSFIPQTLAKHLLCVHAGLPRRKGICSRSPWPSC